MYGQKVSELSRKTPDGQIIDAVVYHCPGQVESVQLPPYRAICTALRLDIRGETEQEALLKLFNLIQ